MGRKAVNRQWLARAFLAKAVYDLPTTNLLIEMLKLQPTLRRLCGFARLADVPSASTFSRAFHEFAGMGLLDIVHAARITEHVGDQIVMHVSRDSTEIDAREKPIVKETPVKQPPKKRGRPKQGEGRPQKELTRLQRQLTQGVEESLSEIPQVCDKGCKRDSKGNPHYWIGWKCHIDWADGTIPLNVVTTSASVHDSQVAIPMMRGTAKRVTSLYQLMDSAYDAEAIREACRKLDQVAIIDPSSRRKERMPFDTVTANRFHERTTAERGNSRLKDGFGFRHLRVRGYRKAHLHLMFGILALFADQLLKPMHC
jgi:IS5 family transposase